MQISGLRIDRFGVWSDLELEGISEGLNVFYGPPGSDVSAILQFLRTVLFGFTDEIRQQYTSSGFHREGGSITVRGALGPQTIRRHADGDRSGRVIVEGRSGPLTGLQCLQDLLAGVSPAAFDRVFLPGSGKPWDVGKVIDVAVAQGFDLIDDSEALQRLDDLRSRLADRRRSLACLEPASRPLDELFEVRRDLTHQIKTLESSADRQRQSLDGLVRKLAAEVRDLEEQLEKLTREANATETELESRREEKRQQERAFERAKWQHQRGLAELGRQLGRMGDQLKRWAHALKDVEAFGSGFDEDARVDEPLLGDVQLSYPGAQSRSEDNPGEPIQPRLGETPSRLAAQDAEIRRLAARREELRAETEMVQGVLRQSRQRLEQAQMDQRRDVRDELLAAKRRELERTEQQIRAAERHRELTAVIVTLEEEIRDLETAACRPSVLREASDLLRRLTAGELDEIIVTRERAVWVANRQGQEILFHQLGSDARDRVCLSICLAVVAAYGRQGARLPVVLDDSLLHFDFGGVETVASLLSDFAGRGHQIFVFTRQRPIADLFQSLGVPARELPRPEMTPVTAAETADNAVASDVQKELELREEQRREVNRQLSAIAEEMTGPLDFVDHPAWSAEEFPGELTDRIRSGQPAGREPAPAAEDDSHEPGFFLRETSPIEEAPSIDSAVAECLRKTGVIQVRDLLQLNVEEAADRLRHAGITAVMIRRWQAESLLVCRVAQLRPYDARILVACGITDPEQLAQTDVGELRRRVEVFGSTETGRLLLRSGTASELSRVTGWIRAARGRSDKEPVVLRMDKGREWKFFLNTADPIERSPSIGPVTAKRLEAIGIRRVADLLRAAPETTAKRLDHRRIKTETVRQWQQQAALACRVPLLRGHDAQILVACGVTDPEGLAREDPKELWKTVGPFLDTNEGKRIIRNGKTPDLEEVSDWIHWARHARKLRAA